METTSYPIYKQLSEGDSFIVKKNNTIAIILSEGATARWASQNGTTGTVSTSMVLGRYLQPVNITAQGGSVELILNGDVQLVSPDALKSVKSTEGNLKVSLEDFAVVMRNILVQAFGRNNLVHSGSNGNAQRVVMVSAAGSIVGDNLTNISQFGAIPVRDGLYSPTDRILWNQAVRSKIS